MYTLCKHCDHFVDLEPDGSVSHLEDGEQEFDHDAEPSNESYSLEEWKAVRPDLFVEHPDGRVGPNSAYHDRRGKAS